MRISLDAVGFTPPLFDRPESVLWTEAGDILASHRSAAAIRYAPDGRHELIGASRPAWPEGEFLPNGIAQHNGMLFIANMTGAGGVWRIDRRGNVVPHLMEVDGVSLTAANFVMFDERGRMWVTSSTRSADRSKPFNENVRDGYIVLSDERGARIVADGLAFTNECRLNKATSALYVCETAGARVSRFELDLDGRLGSRETWTEFTPDTYPDGCTFGSDENLWVASPVGNKLLRVSPDGRYDLVLEDALPGQVEAVEAARKAGKFGREHFYIHIGRRLQTITSVAFGGPDLRTVFLGSLTNDRLAFFRLP